VAPKIIDLLDRMGVPFNRTAEGRRDLRLFGGSLFKRTHFAGAHHRPAAHLRPRRASPPLRVRGQGHQVRVLGVSRPDRRRDRPLPVGIVAQDIRTMQIRSFRADAVVMATGGNGLVFGKSTNSVICTGGPGPLRHCGRAGTATPR
jgi:succinate dehydrogenase / fumarate reductase flavoprotein subunit